MEINTERIAEIFSNLKGKSITVVGDLMLDEYLWGDVERISPEAPVPVIDLSDCSFRLGGSANVAWNIKTLGVDVKLIGIIGDDYSSELIKENLGSQGISSDYLITDCSRHTTRKTRIIARNQQVARLDRENREPLSIEIENRILETFIQAADSSDGIIISDYGKGVVTENVVKGIVDYAGPKGKFIGVDPKEKHFDLFRNVSIITPNTKEAGNIVGKKLVTENNVIQAGWDILHRLNSKAVLITRGEKGMSLFQMDGSLYHFPTVAKKVYDVTGAGDTVISVFGGMVSAGANFVEASIISNYAAGLVVQKIGTASVTVEEIRKALIHGC